MRLPKTWFGGRLTAVVLLALNVIVLADSAWAEWKVYGGGGDTVAYYDTTRVRSEPPYLTAWVRLEFDTPDTINGKQYHSQTQKMALDCKGEAWGVLFSAFYETKEHAGSPIQTINTKVSEVRMQPAIPNSIGENLLKTVCPKPKVK